MIRAGLCADYINSLNVEVVFVLEKRLLGEETLNYVLDVGLVFLLLARSTAFVATPLAICRIPEAFN